MKLLLGIIAAHFAHEEREMPAKNFTGYEEHKFEHTVLLDTNCTSMQIKIEAGELELTEKICQLIKNWFDTYIPVFDMAYSQAFK